LALATGWCWPPAPDAGDHSEPSLPGAVFADQYLAIGLPRLASIDAATSLPLVAASTRSRTVTPDGPTAFGIRFIVGCLPIRRRADRQTEIVERG
jgi:hypothetical protein